ncbi:hypothetical protein N7522_013862 [Penicillium canescens]|nr:hypothetical protein N7522_013862 [Penicillium canescens]
MKMEHNPATPKEEIPSQLQDPLERRRLQNRLSQRNHRRKIRDRIAKLQERVIANELRAAAANGWDQQYIPSPLPHNTHTALSENDLGFISRGVSPLGIEPSTPFMPSYPILSSTSWPSDFNAFPTAGYHGELPPYLGGGILTHSNGMPSSTTAGLGEDTYRDTILPTGEALPPDSLLALQENQPSYYVATAEAALPQILQVINTTSPQSKVIVLVPPTSPASACIPSFPPSNSYTRFENPATVAQQTPPRLTCLCHPQNIHYRSWMDAGSYMQGCPIHKFSNSSAGGFPVRML